ncbi:MAG: flagellar motor protein MotB [Gammaproteobacteria bacterium]|jgi:chemotaxis protein MotB|nr:flagellar motor protein MotB [Gammaproteobacteria bacterium]MBU1467748.1 flagellar motor protein MotB [Gammaproteobacteria bacterium]MBU2024646.1 flagellar motor protein MotB [Gammaproteobacteria bacterium]MBU2238888.1 flagellar motor protein MotB [Gammaproteobacteria bacterium]MBU2319437.1 flagellar motor protein MotB [Gammaproteobacteria bacterium]|tara:strand:- start:38543 stop:39535 length:993 start_codon:yes stop_codon:yes gene_type:complete
MSDEEESDCPECVEGLPAYMGTFADLMSLLMCFFVLLLSFAEMDVLKFKQLAGSLKVAFGVQREVEAESIPMGTSVIAQEFSPGRPEPTPINEVKQKADSTPENTLEVICKPGDAELKEQSNSGSPAPVTFVDKSKADLEKEKKIQETEGDAQMIASVMREEISKGTVEIETQEQTITIRIKDQGSFKSGSAELNYDFIPVIDLIRDVLVGIQGTISVEGHTDNVPIASSRFRSNWQLSSARAISVAEELFSTGQLDQGRFAVTGYADTRPLVPNDTPANRATNRRVEIIVKQNDTSRPKMRNTVDEIPSDGVIEFDRNMVDELKPNEIF